MINLPLGNNSNEDALALFTLDAPSPLQIYVREFWDTVTKTDTPTVHAQINPPTPNPITNTSPQHSGTNPTNPKPSSSVDITPQPADTAPVTSTLNKPSGLSDNNWVTTTAGPVYSPGPGGAPTPPIVTRSANPGPPGPPWTVLPDGDKRYGRFRLDADGDGSLDWVYFVLIDRDPPGPAVPDGTYDRIYMSVGDIVFTVGPTLDDGILVTGNDEWEPTGSWNLLELGPTLSPLKAEFRGHPDGSRAQMRVATWYTGSFTNLDVDGDGAAGETVNFALSDTTSNGLFNAMDISWNNDIYGEPGDVQISGTTDVALGTHTFEVGFRDWPATAAFAARIRSVTWYTGHFMIDIDATDADADDRVDFVLSDTDSDGEYETMDISVDGAGYGDTSGGPPPATLTDNIATTNNDERISSASPSPYYVTFGQYYKFKVEFDNNPATPDPPRS